MESDSINLFKYRTEYSKFKSSHCFSNIPKHDPIALNVLLDGMVLPALYFKFCLAKGIEGSDKTVCVEAEHIQETHRPVWILFPEAGWPFH